MIEQFKEFTIEPSIEARLDEFFNHKRKIVINFYFKSFLIECIAIFNKGVLTISPVDLPK